MSHEADDAGTPPYWTATTRYHMRPAPGGLALVQDFLNTAAAGKPPRTDFLDQPADAQRWLGQALAAYSGTVERAVAATVVGEHDLRALRALRSDVQCFLSARVSTDAGTATAATGTSAIATGSTTVLRHAPTEVVVNAVGQACHHARGTGWRYLESLLLIELLDAQRTGGWARLKLCGNPACAVVFFDRTRNNSGVWHDVHICGNAINLRASRARRRGATSASQAVTTRATADQTTATQRP